MSNPPNGQVEEAKTQGEWATEAKARLEELEKELSAQKERVIAVEEEREEHRRALQLVQTKLRDACEEVQARFQEALHRMQSTENELLTSAQQQQTDSSQQLLEERYRLSNEKLLLLSEKAETAEAFLVEILHHSTKASSSFSSVPKAHLPRATPTGKGFSSSYQTQPSQASKHAGSSFLVPSVGMRAQNQVTPSPYWLVNMSNWKLICFVFVFACFFH